jgi:hypothetical protein
VILFKEVQFRNELGSISIFPNMINFVKLVQKEKAELEMIFVFFGIVILSKPEQKENE